MDAQWHYRDEKSGKRSGPADDDRLAELVAQGRLRRSTLVWNPAMADWAKAATTDLSSLFADAPPALPAQAVNRWAAYVLALLPLWGTVAALEISVNFADRWQLLPQDAFDNLGWIVVFLVLNTVFAEIDEFVLRRAGIRIKGVALLAGVLVPLYLFFSGRALRRETDKSFFGAYLPFVLWFAALVGAVATIANVSL